MGTSYQVTAKATAYQRLFLHKTLKKELNHLIQIASTYEQDSFITTFNKTKTFVLETPIPEDFLVLFKLGKQLYKQSKGAWDPTILPLLRLWGFDTATPSYTPPSKDKLIEIQHTIGFNKVTLNKQGYLQKNHPDLAIDLSSIAKGFAVDKIAEMLEKKGVDNYLVDIGGEIYAKGKNKTKRRWVIGINTPQPNAKPSSFSERVTVSNKALATSGDYRQFFTHNNTVYSHILDPRTGMPIQHNTVSVSILAPTCRLADGLATTCLVLGKDEGLKLLENYKNVEGLFYVKDEHNNITKTATSGFPLLDRISASD